MAAPLRVPAGFGPRNGVTAVIIDNRPITAAVHDLTPSAPVFLAGPDGAVRTTA